MILYKKDDFINISSLLTEENEHYPLLKAMLHGNIKANIYVNSIENFSSTFVIGDNGWCYLIGELSNEVFNKSILEYIESSIMNNNKSIIWFGIPQIIRSELNKYSKLSVGDYPRYQFKFYPERFRKLEMKNIEYKVERITKSNIDEFLKYNLDFNDFWKEKEEFLENGFGFIARYGEKVVGHAISAAVDERDVEIDIQTDSNFRGQSISSRLTYNLIEECIRRNKNPKWDCTVSNIASIRLAEKFGFEIVGEYPLSYIVKKENTNII